MCCGRVGGGVQIESWNFARCSRATIPSFQPASRSDSGDHSRIHMLNAYLEACPPRSARAPSFNECPERRDP
jgi:hypothetical protein